MRHCEHRLQHADDEQTTGRFYCDLCDQYFFVVASGLPDYLQRRSKELIKLEAMMQGGTP